MLDCLLIACFACFSCLLTLSISFHLGVSSNHWQSNAFLALPMRFIEPQVSPTIFGAFPLRLQAFFSLQFVINTAVITHFTPHTHTAMTSTGNFDNLYTQAAIDSWTRGNTKPPAFDDTAQSASPTSMYTANTLNDEHAYPGVCRDQFSINPSTAKDGVHDIALCQYGPTTLYEVRLRDDVVVEWDSRGVPFAATTTPNSADIATTKLFTSGQQCSAACQQQGSLLANASNVVWAGRSGTIQNMIHSKNNSGRFWVLDDVAGGSASDVNKHAIYRTSYNGMGEPSVVKPGDEDYNNGTAGCLCRGSVPPFWAGDATYLGSSVPPAAVSGVPELSMDERIALAYLLESSSLPFNTPSSISISNSNAVSADFAGSGMLAPAPVGDAAIRQRLQISAPCRMNTYASTS